MVLMAHAMHLPTLAVPMKCIDVFARVVQCDFASLELVCCDLLGPIYIHDYIDTKQVERARQRCGKDVRIPGYSSTILKSTIPRADSAFQMVLALSVEDLLVLATEWRRLHRQDKPDLAGHDVLGHDSVQSFIEDNVSIRKEYEIPCEGVICVFKKVLVRGLQPCSRRSAHKFPTHLSTRHCCVGQLVRPVLQLTKKQSAIGLRYHMNVVDGPVLEVHHQG